MRLEAVQMNGFTNRLFQQASKKISAVSYIHALRNVGWNWSHWADILAPVPCSLLWIPLLDKILGADFFCDVLACTSPIFSIVFQISPLLAYMYIGNYCTTALTFPILNSVHSFFCIHSSCFFVYLWYTFNGESGLQNGETLEELDCYLIQ